MKAKLKPCPFCGDCNWHNIGTNKYRVYKLNHSPACFLDTTFMEEWEEDQIYKWNHREGNNKNEIN